MKDIILHDLIDVSPFIGNRVDELMSSAIQQEMDKNTLQSLLISESTSILIELLKNHGIEFHTDVTDVTSDHYNIGFVIMLYRFFIPSAIGEYIKNTPKLLDGITSAIVDVSDEEFIVHILEVARDTVNTEYMDRAYSYLHDKIISTDLYVQVVLDVINKLVIQKDNIEINFGEPEIEFLDQVAQERRWYIVTISDIIHMTAIPVEPACITKMGARFLLNYTSPEHVSILAKFKSLLVDNKTFALDYIAKVRQHSDFHVESYTNSDIQKLSLCMVISIALAQFADKYLFSIEPQFERLIKYAASDIPVDNIIKMIPDHR